MSTNHDGGPAFPRPHSEPSSAAYYEYAQEGMSLRDYFAGQALPWLAAGAVSKIIEAHQLGHAEDAFPILAKACYGVADAMIKARET